MKQSKSSSDYQKVHEVSLASGICKAGRTINRYIDMH